MKSTTLAMIICTIVVTFPGVVQADSPATSTPFYEAYLDYEIVKKADEKGVIDLEIAEFLASRSNPLHVKAAAINALSWKFEGKDNSGIFMCYLSLLYGKSPSELGIEDLRVDDVFCLGYLMLMDDYFHPEEAISALEYVEKMYTEARQGKRYSFTLAIIAAIAKAQKAMDTDWCEVWTLAEDVLENKDLIHDLRPEAQKIIVDYMIMYKENCDEEERFEEAYEGVTVKEWNGCYNDRKGGDLEIFGSEKERFGFNIQVVRGPTAHTGEISGIADVLTDSTAKFIDTNEEYSDYYHHAESCTLWFYLENDGIKVYEEYCGWYHGARAFFGSGLLYERETCRFGSTLILEYRDFGPEEMARELLGYGRWQWDNITSAGDPNNQKEIKVVIFDDHDVFGIPLDIVKQAHPVIKEKHQDYRYISQKQALEYLDRTLRARLDEEAASTLRKTRQLIHDRMYIRK
jgi:hypothetical protein